MTPTPEQVAQWAREAGGSVMQPYDYGAKPDRMILRFEEIHRLVTRAMAEQAEADAKLCEKQVAETSTAWTENEFTEKAYRDGLLEMMQIPMSYCAAAIRANAPKVTT